jgi:hypothetical protein
MGLLGEADRVPGRQGLGGSRGRAAKRGLLRSLLGLCGAGRVTLLGAIGDTGRTGGASGRSVDRALQEELLGNRRRLQGKDVISPAL